MDEIALLVKHTKRLEQVIEEEVNELSRVLKE
jgi:hypothetical protein